ncbi:MAG: tetratricopeptide repeat protein [Planctomycetota bacterium]
MSAKKLSPEIQAIISSADSGHYSTTVILVTQFLETTPDSQRALLDLGHALAQLARFDEAETAFTRACEITPDEPNDVIFGQLGNLFKLQGKLDLAAHWYQKQIDADSNDATGYVFLANLEMRRGNHNVAEKLLLTALQCESGVREEVHNSLGLLYRTKQNFRKSKQHFEQVLESDPKNLIAKQGLEDVKSVLRLLPQD